MSNPMVSTFKHEYYVRIYELSREGRGIESISKALGVTKKTFRRWMGKFPAIRDAIKRGRSRTAKTANGGKEVGQTFQDFVYMRLPPHLKEYWDEISAADKEENSEKMVELLTRHHGKETQQHLFAHALVASSFNAAEACRKVGIPYRRYRNWMEQDPDFLELMENIQEMKKDFVEGSLMSLIAGGDSAATIFASRTLNRDRGYDPKITIKHEGKVLHGTINLDNILQALPVNTQRQILAAVRGENLPALTAHIEPEEALADVEDDDD